MISKNNYTSQDRHGNFVGCTKPTAPKIFYAQFHYVRFHVATLMTSPTSVSQYEVRFTILYSWRLEVAAPASLFEVKNLKNTGRCPRRWKHPQSHPYIFLYHLWNYRLVVCEADPEATHIIQLPSKASPKRSECQIVNGPGVKMPLNWLEECLRRRTIVDESDYCSQGAWPDWIILPNQYLTPMWLFKCAYV